MGSGFRSLVDDLFAAAGVTPRVAFESCDLATIEGLVGSGLVPEQLAGASGTIGVQLSAAGAERIVGLTWRADRHLSPAAARLRHLRPPQAGSTERDGDLGISWRTSVDTQGVYEGLDADGNVVRTATAADLVLGSSSILRGIVEVYSADDAKQTFVQDFAAAWVKVMELDRFDLR